MSRRSVRHLIDLAIEEFRNWFDFRFRSHVPMNGPEAADLGRAYGAAKRRVYYHGRFVGKPKAWRAWHRLTHDGWRTDEVCPRCGAHQTSKERQELRDLYEAYPSPPRPDDLKRRTITLPPPEVDDDA